LSQKRYVFSLPACKTVSILISFRMSFSFNRWNNCSLSSDVVVIECIVNFYSERYDSNVPHLKTSPPNKTNNRSQMRGKQSQIKITIKSVITVTQQYL
jgi:hypothetical protein